MNNKRIALLLGAGTSVAVKMPSTEDITERILSSSGVFHHSSDCYYIDDNKKGWSDWEREPVECIVRFLNWLREVAQLSLRRKSKPNYEDLYLVASQLNSHLSGVLVNFALQPFVDCVLSKLPEFAIKKDSKILGERQLWYLTHETKNYIHDVTSCMLRKPLPTLVPLDALLSVCCDEAFDSVDIFTLNHDRVLECWFDQRRQDSDQKKRHYEDGFSEKTNNLRYWAPERYENSTLKVRLYKLHGSVNWYQYDSENEGLTRTKVAIPVDGSISASRDASGHLMIPSPRPMILLGTFNKMFEYRGLVFDELHCRFSKTLKQVSQLIICGYGFRDRGINYQLSRWIHTGSGRKVILIHHDPDKLQQKAEKDIAEDWKTLKNEKMWGYIRKRVENTTYDDIRNQLEK